ncbi:pseudouridine synthase [Streptomyces oceani]|uniref:Pseudouridine synthase n=1 Tax=Streptomyces oceani TaxID=1075402 RepID=A0A1E7KGV9_9ACTN|nr:pseudouridine synthase [Streptomyces oceani]OEV03113.1 pseudouridine synthase [Streptomyces oceani]
MRSSGNNRGNTGGNRDNRGGGRQQGRSGSSRGGGGTSKRATERPRPEERRHEKGGRPGAGGDAGKPGQGTRGGAGQGRAGGKPGAGKPGGSPGAKPGGKPTGGSAGKPAGKPGGRSGGNPAGKAGGGGSRSNQPGGGPKGPRSTTGSGAPKNRARKPSAPARPREYEAQLEERHRERHSKPALKLPKTFGGEEGERLQKVLARAGMGSRRSCEELIDRARVEVNGEIVTEQGLRVDAEKDQIKVDGLTISTQAHLYFVLNKPAGVVSAMEDPEGRQCLGDYVQNRETRLFHVGRLDTETEGLILLTNNGELSHRLTHPRYGVQKRYLATIEGPIRRDLGKQLTDGIRLDDGYARADNFRVVENVGRNYLVEVTLHEGRRHIVRRMLAEAGFPVDRLVRTRFGPIALGDQKSGWLRRLTNTEVGMLMSEVDL